MKLYYLYKETKYQNTSTGKRINFGKYYIEEEDFENLKSIMRRGTFCCESYVNDFVYETYEEAKQKCDELNKGIPNEEDYQIV